MDHWEINELGRLSWGGLLAKYAEVVESNTKLRKRIWELEESVEALNEHNEELITKYEV